jgi:hypothetical protein
MSVARPIARRPSAVRSSAHPSAATTQLPSAAKLRNVLATWEFHSPNHQIPWKKTKPAGAVLKTITIKKAPTGGRTGDSVHAHILKSNKVYFSKGGSTQTRYYGAVRYDVLPKVGPAQPKTKPVVRYSSPAGWVSPLPATGTPRPTRSGAGRPGSP